jgi:Protein of unknown function (DUF4038)
MPSLSIDPSGSCLRLDGAPFPLVIDTAWSVFADAAEEDWRMYLAARRRQGFTAVLVSLLYIPHDRVERPGRQPFLLDASGRPDFARPDPAYLEVARRLVAIAHDEFGVRVMLTVLWNNFLPGTWGAKLTPDAVMSDIARRGLVDAVATTFADLEPIFVIGGDDHYTAPEANAAYIEAADVLRAASPRSLLTTHTAPRAVLPEELADRLDFFLHQTGHNIENQELPWTQPADYLRRRPRKPLVNSEPPYELHGKVGGHGRWGRADVRRASWASVLSGAAAGIGYGAHGVWMWATTRGEFTAAGSSLPPFTWVEALSLPGALDISLMAGLMRDHELHRLSPAQELLDGVADDAFRCAASPDRDLVALYLPYALAVSISLDLREHRLTTWDLHERAPMVVDAHVADGRTRLGQLFSTGDQLVIAERR